MNVNPAIIDISRAQSGMPHEDIDQQLLNSIISALSLAFKPTVVSMEPPPIVLFVI